MLELEKLNDQSFDDIVEKAVRSIARFDTEWNNLQASDPGMTLVDLFAWLKALQHEYMSVIVPESQRRFLSLLGITRRTGRGSSTLVELSGAEKNLILPAETKWTAGDMVFENPVPAVALSARLTGICFSGGGSEQLVDPSALDGTRIFEIFPGLGPEPASEPDGALTLFLSAPAPSGCEFSLYFEICADSANRVPVNGEPFCPMADISWDVWTEKGWEPAEVTRDDTYGFLFSGVVTLRHSAEMAETESGFAVRAHLVRDDYDLPPRLTAVRVNVIELCQQDTLVRCDVFEAGESPVLTSELGIYGQHRVFIEDATGWYETEDFYCEPQPDRGRAVLSLPGYSGRVMAVCFDKRAADHIVLGNGTGFSGQEIPFEQQDALYDSVRLMVGRQTPAGVRFSEWEKCEDFYSSGPESRHFIWDAGQRVLRFGDHVRGVMPPKGKDNILLIGLKTCRGQDSDIRAGMVSRAQSPDAHISALQVRQIVPASGGEDPESLEEMAARAADTLRTGARAVTEEDYLAAVHAVPGLIVENCRVLTGFEGENDRRITVVVQGAGRARYVQRRAYVENIRMALDRCRLLNTQVQVVWPQPVRLLLRARIITAPYYHDAGTLVRRRAEEFIAQLNRRFGTALSYGELYCAIDLMDCVSSIESLSVEPLGEWIAKTGTDDIIVSPNSYYEIERFELNFINSLD